MPSDKFEGICIVAKRQENQKNDFDLRVRSSLREGQHLRVVEIRYVPTADADARLSRAIDILLRAGARHAAPPEENLSARRTKPPCQAPAPDTLADTDGECNDGNRRTLQD